MKAIVEQLSWMKPHRSFDKAQGEFSTKSKTKLPRSRVRDQLTSHGAGFVEEKRPEAGRNDSKIAGKALK